MDKLVITFLFLVVFVGGFILLFSDNQGFLPYQTDDAYLPTIYINGTQFKIEVARSPESRKAGLSTRDSMEFGRGMLFPFATNDAHAIWMRNMKFPIDIIWLDENLVVVDIKRDARPESYPEIFRPKSPARYVLEINATLSEVYNIKIGDKASISTL